MIAAVIVYFNPPKDVFLNISGIIENVDKIYIVDNSNRDNSNLINFDSKKIDYIPFFQNKGIAYALKFAVEKALNEKYDFILTLDQDSIMSNECFEIMLDYIHKNDMSKVAIVAPEFVSRNNKIEFVDYVITSGNIINLSIYKRILGFNQELFIDFVDFDLCYQFREKDFQIVKIGNAFLKHSLGDGKKMSLFGMQFTNTNHSSIRKYYLYRNEYYCSHLNKKRKKFFKKIHRRLYTIDLIKILLFEKDKINKFKMIKKAIKDAKKNKLGAFTN